jgi:hypothetical protein
MEIGLGRENDTMLWAINGHHIIDRPFFAIEIRKTIYKRLMQLIRTHWIKYGIYFKQK